MSRCKKTVSLIISAVICFTCIICSAPITHAAGLMRLIIDGTTYSKVYTDTGSLLLSHWQYDASEDILKLDNFGTASSPKSKIFAYPYSGTMTIELSGNNYITSEYETAVSIIGNVNFTGTGSLTIVCNNSYCIYTDYTMNIGDSVSFNINGLAGITAQKGFVFNTTGNINVNTVTKCLYTYGDINIKSGNVNLRGDICAYTAEGNIYMSGGTTNVEMTSTQRAMYIVKSDCYVEWSANAAVTAGNAAPGVAISAYNNEKYFHATFSGTPKLNYPRKIFWDETVIDSGGTTNPVGRWSAVANATGYVVNLYYYDGSSYSLMESFTVTDALSCNFGGHFTTYGKYFFTVKALGNDVDFLTSNESPRVSSPYYFSGDIASRYYVTLPESQYFEIVPVSGSTVVYYGDSYSFTIEIDPAYTQSEILVWANKARIALRHGMYTIDNVTENITITVGDLSMNTYTVNLPTSEAYTIYPLPDYSTDVAYGGSFAFSIELSDIYLQSYPVVTSNGVELIPKYGIIYTIDNITADQNVEISGLIRDNYTVTFKQLNGDVVGTQTVDYGYNASAPTEPTLADGLTFVGWYNADGTEYDFQTPITNHKTLYARYEAPRDTDGYYLISTLDQLKWFRDEVNFGNADIDARLCNNISMNSGNYVMVGNEAVFSDTAETWKPIGGYDYTDEENYVRFYNGNFDGDGYTLSGFCCKFSAMSADASFLGIFGAVDSDATISDLNVTRSSFDGYGYIGGIAGRCLGEITNCTSSASCSGYNSVGGIVGSCGNNISNCENTGVVTVEQYVAGDGSAPVDGTYGGGIVGRLEENNIVVSDCTNSGKVSAYSYAGGIVGYAYGYDFNNQVHFYYNLEFARCTNSAPVTGSTNSGGICGFGGSKVDSCSNSGVVSGSVTAGGIIAENEGAIYTDVSNTGSVTSQGCAGGICAIGSVNSSLRVFNSGNVNGGTFAGGITGKGDISLNYGYNGGDVTAAAYAGGFAGKSENILLHQCHSFGNATAQATDAFSAVHNKASATATYFCKEKFQSNVCGTGALNDWFYSGYLAYTMNNLNGSPFWAQGDLYPVFSTDENPAFVLPFSGSSTLSNPYTISNERELRLVSALINNEIGFEDEFYSLTADITLHNSSDENNFAPIGSSAKHFIGLFNGNSHTISGINISSTQDNVGLFSYIEGGMVENLTIDNCSFSGKTNVGAIAGYCDVGYIYSCTVKDSTVTGYENVGGIAGHQSGDTYRCTNCAAVSGTISVGGLVGFNEDNSVTNSFNYGNVTGISDALTQSTEVGGCIGKSFGTVLDCGNSGTVSANSYAGGIVGINYGSLTSLYNNGNVSSAENYGGICGSNQSENEAEACFYLSGCVADGGSEEGTPQTEIQVTNGTTAYYLNLDGQSLSWLQGSEYPDMTNEDGDYAVIYAYRFVSFEEDYYFAATYADGSITPPAQPSVSGYNFLRWDKSLVNINESATTHAVFDRSAYITFTPTATISSIDNDSGSIIVGINPDDKMTAGDLLGQIANEKIVVSDADGVNELGEDDYIFTGTTVQLYEEVGVFYHTAWVVIFGDINGDGIVDGYDAFLLGSIVSGMISEDDLSYPQQLAADVDGDGAITQADVTMLESYCLNGCEINQSRNINS